MTVQYIQIGFVKIKELQLVNPATVVVGMHLYFHPVFMLIQNVECLAKKQL